MNRFNGDGRTHLTALPQDVLPGTRPIRLSRSMCRRLVENFRNAGGSSHSGAGGALWVIREHCRVNNVPHSIEGEPGEGFYVTYEDNHDDQGD